MSNIAPKSEVPILNKEQLEVLASLSEENPKAVIEDLLNTFINNWPETFSNLKSACKNKSTTELRAIIHKLNGSSSNIGLEKFGTICRNIETQIHQNKFIDYDNCPQLIEKEYNTGIKTLKTYISEL